VAMAAAIMERNGAVDPAGAHWAAAEYARVLGHAIPDSMPASGQAFQTMPPSAVPAPSPTGSAPPPFPPAGPPADTAPTPTTLAEPGSDPAPGYGYQAAGYQPASQPPTATYQAPGQQPPGYQQPGYQPPAGPYQQPPGTGYPPPGYPSVPGYQAAPAKRQNRSRLIIIIAAAVVILGGGGVAVATLGHGPVTGAACLPGTWKLTSGSTTVSNTAYGTISMHYLSGTQTLTFRSHGGSITLANFAQQANLSNGDTIRLVENASGPGMFTYHASDGRISYATMTVPGTIAVYRDGTEISAATEQSIATATPDQFSCSGTTLTRSGAGYSYRYTKTSH
jgi:hypothetical protein